MEGGEGAGGEAVMMEGGRMQVGLRREQKRFTGRRVGTLGVHAALVFRKKMAVILRHELAWDGKRNA